MAMSNIYTSIIETSASIIEIKILDELFVQLKKASIDRVEYLLKLLTRLWLQSNDI